MNIYMRKVATITFDYNSDRKAQYSAVLDFKNVPGVNKDDFSLVMVSFYNLDGKFFFFEGKKIQTLPQEKDGTPVSKLKYFLACSGELEILKVSEAIEKTVLGR